jgi:hypothetical protein
MDLLSKAAICARQSYRASNHLSLKSPHLLCDSLVHVFSVSGEYIFTGAFASLVDMVHFDAHNIMMNLHSQHPQHVLVGFYMKGQLQHVNEAS